MGTLSISIRSNLKITMKKTKKKKKTMGYIGIKKNNQMAALQFPPSEVVFTKT